MRDVSKKRVPEPTPQNRVSVLFVFSFLAVLGSIGAAAWLFLIDPKDEKQGILTAKVEIGAPIIIESDADPVPTELENAAGATLAPSITETAADPTGEPASPIETEPEKTPEPVTVTEPVQSEETADVIPATAEPTIAEVEEPASDAQPAEETLTATPDAKPEPEISAVVTEATPAPPAPTEETTVAAEIVEPLSTAVEPTEDLEAAPTVSTVEEPVAPAEAPETIEDETAPVVATVEKEATNPPAVPVSPDPAETAVDPAETAVVTAPEIPKPDETPEVTETTETVREAEATSPVTEPVSETTDETETPEVTETVGMVQEPEIPALSETLPPPSEYREETVPTDVAASDEQPEPEDPAPVVIEPSDTARELKEETPPQELALVIPPAPVEAEEFRVGSEPEQISTALAVAPAPPLWQTHARAFDDPLNRPRIALIIGEMGVSSAGTAAAIDGLPGAVTLAFNPYGQNLQSWIIKAREAGHEVLLQLPMEPVGYPRINPGPQALLTSLDTAANLERLEWALGRIDGYVGITNQMGSRFTASKEHIRPVLEVVKEKGLLYLDSRTASNSVGAQVASELSLPVALNNRFLDHKADGELIDARLAELEEIARRTGSAVGVAYPYSLTLEHVSRWADGLADKDIVLAPVSALVNRQDIK